MGLCARSCHMGGRSSLLVTSAMYVSLFSCPADHTFLMSFLEEGSCVVRNGMSGFCCGGGGGGAIWFFTMGVGCDGGSRA
eukprot:13943985-Ditylum_brightwellii.AAC.1